MNRLEAKRHWRKRTTEWRAWAEKFAQEVIAIDDPVLRFTVAATLDACASGGGYVMVRRAEGDKIRLMRFELDPDVTEVIKAGIEGLDPEADPAHAFELADVWMKTRLKTTSAVQVAWTVGPLREVRFHDEESLKAILIDHLVYDVPKGRFVGVKLDDGSLYKIG